MSDEIVQPLEITTQARAPEVGNLPVTVASRYMLGFRKFFYLKVT